MDKLLYVAAWILLAIIQRLPLTWAARAGRLGGALSYWIDLRHRRVSLKNIRMCFPSFTDREVRQLARENFRRLGENYTCAVKTASMTLEELKPHCRFVGIDRIVGSDPGQPSPSRVFAIGHFGNFELYARFGQYVPGYVCAATYRALKQPGLTRLMQSLRQRSGCRFFERRTEGAALRALFTQPRVMLGILADQHAGRRGIWQPFLGHLCSTSPAPALFALRYRCPLHVGICYRVALARWEIEIGEEIPTFENGRARAIEDITHDMNRVFERAVLRDPANWFWVHRRWKPPRPESPQPARVPAHPASAK